MSSLEPPRPKLGFGVRRADIKTRADVNYAQMAPTVADLLRRAAFPMVRLGDLVSKVQYGTSSRALPEEVGSPMLRMVNLQNGDWDLSELKYTTLSDREQKPYVLEKGDILFTRTNGSKDLVGKCAVFREDSVWIFASYVIRVRLRDADEYNPEFLARFLNSAVGRVQIDQLSRQALMTNINAQEIRELRVPHPPKDVQQPMVDDLAVKWSERQEALAKVAELLAAGDSVFASELGVTLPTGPFDSVYAGTRATLRRDDRLNAEFFHPERVLTIRAIADTLAKPLHEVADRVGTLVAAPIDPAQFIGLANIERDTGERVATTDDLPEGACMAFKKGDILFSKLRPYLNKVHLAEADGVCSPEFLVLRPKKRVRAQYLESVLRSKVVLAQTRHMAGGNTHPRLLPRDVDALLVPLPDEPTQHRLADEAAARRSEAQELKAKAEQEWTDAKQRFGDALLEP